MPPAPDRPRFPRAEAAFCLASLAAVTYVWMVHSYAWPVTVDEVHSDFVASRRSRAAWTGAPPFTHPHRFCALRGTLTKTSALADGRVRGAFKYVGFTALFPAGAQPEVGVEGVYSGRMTHLSQRTNRFMTIALDATASRFTIPSVLGLAIGTMASGLFLSSLLKWKSKRLQDRPHNSSA
jgi:hypothetical protein